jgi:hypothetical protein
MREAHRLRLGLEHPERVGVHVAPHRQVVAARREVMADRQHVDVVGAHVAHDLQDLVVGLAEADHDAALGRHVRREFLESPQQTQGVGVVGSRPGFLVEARRGFQVVVHHIGRRAFQDLEGPVHAAAEVGRQDLDARLGRELARLLDAGDEVAGAAVAQVVAVDAGDDDVLQLQRGDVFARLSGSSTSSGSDGRGRRRRTGSAACTCRP